MNAPRPDVLQAAMDRVVVAKEAKEPPRKHLGISVIGQSCERRLVYEHRWAAREVFEARMLRLFQRGHLQEFAFAKLLRDAGATVWLSSEHKGEELAGFRVTGVGGHYGGTCDAIAANVPGAPTPDALLVEMKTHNDNSFGKLKEQGLNKSKPLHFQQAQTYAGSLGYTWCLYMAVNKNDDEMFLEYIRVNPRIAADNLRKAARVIGAEVLPPKVSEKPGWHECRFCPAHDLCHSPDEAPLPVNCRTCQYAAPDLTGTVGKWTCAKGNAAIKKQAGCALWEPAVMLEWETL